MKEAAPAGISRRMFLAGATSLAAAPALAQPNANDRLGIAMIGVGTRGIYLLEQVQQCPNVEIRIICDLYDGNLKRASARVPKAMLTKEWEKTVASPDVDAVFVATPDFWHAPIAMAAARAKKHVYVEKALCRTLEEAKGIRQAVRDNKVVLQLGHHQNSDPFYTKAREIFRSGQLGKTVLARTYIDRTSTWPEWQFYTAYNIQKRPADANEQTIDWARFIANAPARPFDAERFFRWRCWWDYGTGIAGDLMSHQWDGVNMIVGMGIPEAVQTMGGLYFWKEDREVPDQWHVLYEYPKQELNVLFSNTFHNRHSGTGTFILGRDATLEVSTDWCRLFEGEWKPKYANEIWTLESQGRTPPPVYSMKKGELEVSSHMRNFIDCIRTGETPRCGMERAWEEAVTVVMSVEAYRKERKVRWDAAKEEIV